MITVICPRCGRPVHAREKYVESSGGIPCLKCKVRISISKEQMGAYAVTEDGNPGAGSGIPTARAENGPESVTSETAALPSPLLEQPPPSEPSAQEAAAPLTGTDTDAPAITVEAASVFPVKTSDSDTPAIPVTAIFHNEVWEGSPEVAADNEPETMHVLRRELAEAKAYAVSVEEMLTRLSQEKVATELGLLRKNRDAETRYRESVEKVKAREDEMLGLRNAVHALEAQMGELTSALSSKTEECRAIDETKGKEAAVLSEKIETLERRAGDLTAALTAKAGEIQDLRASKEADEDALLKRVLDMKSKHEALVASMKAHEDSLQTVLSRKDEEIQSLLAKISEREEQAFKMAVMVKGWEDRMKEVTDKESQLKALFDLLEFDLKKEIDAHQKLLASLRHQLQAA